MSLIVYVLNADSDRYVDALINHAQCASGRTANDDADEPKRQNKKKNKKKNAYQEEDPNNPQQRRRELEMQQQASAPVYSDTVEEIDDEYEYVDEEDLQRHGRQPPPWRSARY